MKQYQSIIFKFFNFSIAALLLTSCGLYNKYERPEVMTDGIVRDPVAANAALQSTDTASFGNLPWRQLFTDSLSRD